MLPKRDYKKMFIEKELGGLGKRIQAARLVRNLSIRKTAELAGVSESSVRSAEKGKETLSMGIYLKLLIVLGGGRDLERILDDEEYAMYQSSAFSRELKKTHRGKQTMLLMNRNTPVFSFSLWMPSLTVDSVVKIYDLDAGPVCLIDSYKNKEKLIADFLVWLKDRTSPLERIEYGCDGRIYPRVFKNHAINLSTPYWLKREGEGHTWETINPFTRDFEHLGPSPDICTNGMQRKYWEIRNGTTRLIKETGGGMEAAGEVFASRILDRLGIPHVPYDMEMRGDIAVSRCPLFTSEKVEYVPAWEILGKVKPPEGYGLYEHFLACVESWHIPVTEKEIGTMLLFDDLIANRDRHMGNFGFLRDTENGEFLGMAPLFDHGASPVGILYFHGKDFCRPFASTFREQRAYAKKGSLSLDSITGGFLEEIIPGEGLEEKDREKMISQVMKNKTEIEQFL